VHEEDLAFLISQLRCGEPDNPRNVPRTFVRGEVNCDLEAGAAALLAKGHFLIEDEFAGLVLGHFGGNRLPAVLEVHFARELDLHSNRLNLDDVGTNLGLFLGEHIFDSTTITTIVN
jgi:hypothetical protein